MNRNQKSSNLFWVISVLLFGLYSCENVQVPTIETLAISELTENSTLSGGNILSDGGAKIIEKGICWKKSYVSTIADHLVVNSEDVLKFTSQLTDLEGGTAFCVRAYAKNSEGIGYGSPVYFTTYPYVPFVSDVSISEVTTKSAVVEGHFVFGAGLIIVSTGLCYSLSPNAGLSNSYVPSEVVSDSIKLNLPGLQSNTVYYVRLCVLLRLTSSTNYYAVLGNESTFKTKIIPPIPTLPTVKTGSVSSVSNATAEIYGEVLSDGNSSIIKRGICIGINDSPTISGTMFLSEAGVGKFNIKLEKLNPATTYYARAFATNSAGTAYGLQVRFKTYTGTVEDITGQIYTTMQFGTQLWMRENLRTSKLNDGTAIPLVIDYNTWYTLPTPGYCWYGNKEDTIFGALYNWNAVNTNKLCPSGWHVPTYNEWKILINLFGGIQNSTTNFNLRDTMVGFLALFGGFRSYTEYDYADKNVQGYWWASTDENCYFLDANGVQIGQAYQELYSFQKRLGLSVRCIKDN